MKPLIEIYCINVGEECMFPIMGTIIHYLFPLLFIMLLVAVIIKYSHSKPNGNSKVKLQ